MRNARHVIAVTLVATAICADRVTAAAPVQQPMAQFAGRLMERLTVTLRRVLPATSLYEPRRLTMRPVKDPVRPAGAAIRVPHLTLSPFQFRLPPPLV